MLQLAGNEGDGAILNWLAPGDVPRVAAEVGPGKELMCRVFVYPMEDFGLVRKYASRHANAYLNVPVYRVVPGVARARDALAPMWDVWVAGDRARATELIPDEVIDELVVWGDPDRLRAGVERYREMGVTTPVPMIVTTDRNASAPRSTHSPRGSEGNIGPGAPTPAVTRGDRRRHAPATASRVPTSSS